jgi:hypothetical protein
MKNFLTLLLLLSLLVGYANAKERANKQANETKSIEELVQEIKANPSNRRIAINRLKIQLRNINADIRRKIMLDLQHSFTGHTYATTHKNLPIANNVSKPRTASFGSIPNTKKPISRPINSMQSPINSMQSPINIINRPIKSMQSPIKPSSNHIKPMQSPIKSMPSPIKPLSNPIKSMQSPIKSMPSPIKASSNPIKSILPFSKP